MSCKFTTKNFFHSYYNYWVPAEEPLIPSYPNRPYLNLTEANSITRWKREYTFVVAGTDHMSVQISPMQGVNLVGWSFKEEVGRPSKRWNERDVFFIHYVHGLDVNNMKEFQFKLTFETEENLQLPYTFEIALSAHFVHQQETLTTEYKDFIKSFPKWTNVQHWTSLYLSYQY